MLREYRTFVRIQLSASILHSDSVIALISTVNASWIITVCFPFQVQLGAKEKKEYINIPVQLSAIRAKYRLFGKVVRFT
uniref:AlNc14C9G1178 protein n=1 Tax=Albugo laibachii Nc14 TaxID=890382 RepID=F0W2C8_9STRA|nr:AlNc14C9G1178 [Albugo laibachii Nc14]|eukprot:CCA15213.1 AlNc14C9G1178 [Albugo laibachii Nc14]